MRATFPRRLYTQTREERIDHAIQMTVGYARYHTPEYFAEVMGVSYWIYRLSDTKPEWFEILRQLKHAFMTEYVVNPVRIPGTVHTVGLCVLCDESDDFVIPIYNKPIPNNTRLMLYVPQLHEWTVFPPKEPKPRLVSERAKKWNLSVDMEYLAQYRESEDEIQEEMDCVICSESCQPNAFVRLGCGHEYCVDCLMTLVQANKDKTSILGCPICRCPIENVSSKNPDTYTTMMMFITDL
jgi:hypothetical protein